MQSLKSLTSKLKQLPDEQRREVAELVDFLLSRGSEPVDAARVLRESAGIWGDEVDGITYENRMRQQWERRH